MQPNVIAVGNQKGGVGKTTLTANLGGILAAAGFRTLVVDLDPQGNLGTHLGVDREATDQGRNLLDAVVHGDELAPLTDVRPGLDLVPAGRRWRVAIPQLARLNESSAPAEGLDAALGRIADRYQLILLDTPPGDEQVQLAAQLAAHYLVIPTGIDPSSLEVLQDMLAQAVSLKTGRNPWLEALGIVVFRVPSRSAVYAASVRSQLEEMVGESIRVFGAVIRDVAVSAAKAQRAGLLVHEAEAAARDQEPWWASLRAGGAAATAEAAGSATGRLDETVMSHLADDYVALAKELLDEFHVRQSRYVEAMQ